MTTPAGTVPALRIVIADDQASVREGLVLLLKVTPGIEVAAAAVSGLSVLDPHVHATLLAAVWRLR